MTGATSDSTVLWSGWSKSCSTSGMDRIAHSLDKALEEPPEYTDLYWSRDQLVPIMNDLSGLIEHRTHEWSGHVAEHESTAIGFGKVLQSGFDALGGGT